MSKASYRPLEINLPKIERSISVPRGSISGRSSGHRSATVRKVFFLILVVVTLVGYMVWCTLLTPGIGNFSFAGKTELPDFITNALKIISTHPQRNENDYMKSHAKSTTDLNKHGENGLLPPHALIQNPLLEAYLRKKYRANDNEKQKPLTSALIGNESLAICSNSFVDHRTYIQNKPRHEYDQLPIIYFVTPTYPRRVQFAELTRLAQTLMHIPRLHWIVADDFEACNNYMNELLQMFGIPFTHLSSPMPKVFRKKKPMPRGVANRRAALSWLRQRNITQGVLYFGDDDNTYDLRLFPEIRTTQRVSMFPVGLIDDYGISGPVVRMGKVVGFLDSWVAERHWPVDMAGFAVNLAFMSEHPNASMPYKPGYEEDYFLRSIGLKLDYIEPKGGNCSEVLVWHTQTKNRSPATTVRIGHSYLDNRSNLGDLFHKLELMGITIVSEKQGHNAIISKNGKVRPLAFFLS